MFSRILYSTLAAATLALATPALADKGKEGEGHDSAACREHHALMHGQSASHRDLHRQAAAQPPAGSPGGDVGRSSQPTPQVEEDDPTVRNQSWGG